MPNHKINFSQLSVRLRDLFAIVPEQYSPVLGGYMCQNFLVITATGRFFLKQYRKRISHYVQEVKFAERYFASAGAPVITAVPDRFGRDAFYLDDSWYSLFPFVDGVSPQANTLTPAALAQLGTLLALLHRAGTAVAHHQFQPLRLWNRDAFRLEYVELEQALLDRQSDQFFQRVLATLRRKAAIVEHHHRPAWDYAASADCLLHGDFIYSNVFIDSSGAITHLYDFEKTCVGPRAYELARSLILNCFDEGWTEKNFAQARVFLSAYRRDFDLPFDDFATGVRLYMVNLAHMTWMEAKFIFFDAVSHRPLYERHAARIAHVEDDLDVFCKQVWS